MPRPACSESESCPAKINLTLAVTGRREDGFHNLHSIVAQTEFGDRLFLDWDPAAQGPDQLSAGEGKLPEGDNSVLQAIRLFREKTGLREGRLSGLLDKRIPIGAGLGGGSSDAAAALRILQRMFPDASAGHDWVRLSASIGSDCPLFFSSQPVLMRGRGEWIEALPPDLVQRLSGQPVLLFMPPFPISTPEAYRRLAAARLYTLADTAAASFAEWQAATDRFPPTGNDFERLARHWMPSLGVVLDRLHLRAGLDARLSGSGSACFAFAEGGSFDMEILASELESAWGPHAWVQFTCLK